MDAFTCYRLTYYKDELIIFVDALSFSLSPVLQ
jgi:hypothetical protein